MHGVCLCGEIAFEIAAPPTKLYQCHCKLCRKQGGSASNTAFMVPRDGLRFTRGAGQIKSWVRDTGFRSDFCSRCGSPVPNPLRDTPYYWVPAGLLEDDAALKIVSHIYVGSAAAWDAVAQPGTHHDTMPPLDEFIASLGEE